MGPSFTNGINRNHQSGHPLGRSSPTEFATSAHTGFNTVEEAVAAFEQGEFVIVLDSPSRENEGDLIIAASAITPEQMAFLIHHSSGYICAPITQARADELVLPFMVPAAQANDPNRTAYTVTVDADCESISTGISASDRAVTCRWLSDRSVAPSASAFRRPGHVVPLIAREGGVRERRGHTEACIDLCRLAGKNLAGVIGELVDQGVPDPTKPVRTGSGMMRRDSCLAFGKRWNIPVITIDSLVRHLELTEGKLEGVVGVDY